jgi:hypothetical protein
MDMMAYSFKWGQMQMQMVMIKKEKGGLNCNLIFYDLAKGI